MSLPEKPAEATEKGALEVDVYGVKVSLPVGPAPGPPRPKSWFEVWHRVQGYLRGMADDLFGLPADALSRARAVVRGVGPTPASAPARVAKAHKKADRLEDKKQEQAATGHPGLPAPDAAENVADILRRPMAEGYAVEMWEEGGRVCFSITRPELREAAREAANIALGDVKTIHFIGVNVDDDADLQLMGLPKHTRAALMKANIVTLSALLACSAGDLLALDGFGEKSLEAVQHALRGQGLKLRND